MQTVQAKSETFQRHAAAINRVSPAVVLGIAALLLISVPYLLGYARAPHGTHFLGQIFIVDDYCVYLSWARQAVDGHFFARNLFTTDPQRGIEFNLFFLLIGAISRIAHLSIIDVLQAARFVSAALLFASVYRLYKLCLPTDPTTRTTAFALALFGSGLAWLHFLKDHDIRLIYPSADSNQPEAFVFTTAYFGPLQAISTAILCEIMRNLTIMAIEGRARFAVIAGFWLLILGNIHSYDVIHIAGVWTAAIVAVCIARKRLDLRLIGLSTIVGLIGAPSTAYQYYMLKHEPVFFQRAMETYTRTPDITAYVFGYGLILVLAIVGARALLRKEYAVDRTAIEGIDPKFLILMCWAAVPLVLIYAVHLPFQRKLLMGEDIPLSLLAGIGAVWITRRSTTNRRRWLPAAIVLSTTPSLFLFVARDIATVRDAPRIMGSTPSPYLSGGEQSTLSWLATNTRPSNGIVAPIRLSLLIPGFCDRYVWFAHWSETPHCEDRVRQFSDAFAVTGTDTQRIDLLREARAEYLCYPNNPNHPSLAETTPNGFARRYIDLSHNPPAYLRPVDVNSEYTVFAVSLP